MRRGWNGRWLLLMLLAFLVPASPRAAGTITVGAGDSLQAAINAAQPGDVILLEAGATFRGNFTLPNKGPSTQFITIRTGGADPNLPAPGTRVGPGHAALLATIRSSNTMTALRTEPGAHHWRLELLQFAANQRGYGDIIALGSGGADQSTIGAVPHDLVLDRLLIRGDPVIGQKRGISLNSASTTITNSYIADCKGVGMDTQAIAGWNGPGPYTISNNYLEGAGENFMLGGARTMSADLSPRNITFTRNHLAKPIAWRDPILTTPMSVRASGQAGGSLPAGTYYYFVVAARPTALDAWAWSAKSAQVSATVGAGGQVTVTWTGDSKATVYRVYRGKSSGTADRYFTAAGTSFTDTGSVAPAGTDSGSWIRASRWSVKNLFELKQGVQVLVDGNLMEGNWVESQNGFAVLFTPRSEDGMCPWAAVQDVVFSNNVVRKSASAISILGVDYNQPSQHAERIRIVNNIFERIGSADFPGPGILLQIGDGAVDVVFDHNTAAQSGNAVVAYGDPNPGFTFTNNLLRHGPYGIKGDGKAPGSDSIAAFLPGGSVTANGFGCSPNTGACTARYYPPGNLFLAEADWQAQFVGYGVFDFRLVSGSAFNGAGTDGTALGADPAAIAAAAAATYSREAPRAPTGVVIR